MIRDGLLGGKVLDLIAFGHLSRPGSTHSLGEIGIINPPAAPKVSAHGIGFFLQRITKHIDDFPFQLFFIPDAD